MMPFQLDEHGESPIQIGEFSSPNFDISWAGSCPWRPSYCYGSDDGRIWFTSDVDSEATGPIDVSPSREAINGIAFGAGRMAVSTRSDIVILDDPFSGKGKVKKAVYTGGSHGVVATQTGGFVAPLGRRGVLVIGDGGENSLQARILTPADASFYAYKLAILSAPDRGTILVMAGRQAGLVSVALSDEGEKTSGRHLHPSGVDFVDVTGIGMNEFPFAVAALSLDCSIHLARDLHDDRSSRKLHFTPPAERAYRLICAEEHLFILTDMSLYTFPEFARWFIEGRRPERRLNLRKLALEAVDMTLSDDRSLLIVTPSGLLRIEIDTLIPARHSQVNGAEPTRESNEDFDIEAAIWEQSEQFELACMG